MNDLVLLLYLDPFGSMWDIAVLDFKRMIVLVEN